MLTCSCNAGQDSARISLVRYTHEAKHTDFFFYSKSVHFGQKIYVINDFEFLFVIAVADGIGGDPKGVLVSKTLRFNQIITNSH